MLLKYNTINDYWYEQQKYRLVRLPLPRPMGDLGFPFTAYWLDSPVTLAAEALACAPSPEGIDIMHSWRILSIQWCPDYSHKNTWKICELSRICELSIHPSQWFQRGSIKLCELPRGRIIQDLLYVCVFDRYTQCGVPWLPLYGKFSCFLIH